MNVSYLFLNSVPTELKSRYESNNLSGKTLAGLVRENTEATKAADSTRHLKTIFIGLNLIVMYFIGIVLVIYCPPHQTMVLAIGEAFVVLLWFVLHWLIGERTRIRCICYEEISDASDTEIQKFRNLLAELNPANKDWVKMETLTDEALQKYTVYLAARLSNAERTFESVRHDKQYSTNDVVNMGIREQECREAFNVTWKAMKKCATKLKIEEVFDLAKPHAQVLH